MKPGTLEQLKHTEAYVEFNLRVKARVLRYHDSHGACVLLQLERRNYSQTAEDGANPRAVWIDADEIIEVQGL